VFTDPPYNVNYQGGGGAKRDDKILNDKMSDGDFLEFLKNSIANIVENTRGALYIFMGDSQIHNLFNAFKSAGGSFKSWIIWEKNHFVLGGKDYHSQSELILHGTPDEYDTSDGEFIMYGWAKHEWYGGRKQGNVWHFDKPVASVLHPTMKPVMLCAKAITNSSKPDGLVLDLFLGGGSTLIAAEKTGRICYGMELDPKYVDVIIKRWEDYTNDKEKKVQ
jgi:DNA modification methylase